MDNEITIRLSRDEFESLILMMGCALGAAIKLQDPKLAGSFLKVANIVNKDNPNWTPYEELEG